jgi:hypothetical protein
MSEDLKKKLLKCAAQFELRNQILPIAALENEAGISQ